MKIPVNNFSQLTDYIFKIHRKHTQPITHLVYESFDTPCKDRPKFRTATYI